MGLTNDFKAAPSASLPDLSGTFIDNGRILLDKVIGRGAWGRVYLAKDISSPTTTNEPQKLYAVKCITSRNVRKGHRKAINREIGLHDLCSENSDLVLKVLNIIDDVEQDLIFIVSEYCPDGDLLEMIISLKYFGNDNLIRSVFVQILDAVDACHKLNVYHRDLKPENILCKDGGKRIALADFGFATMEEFTSDFRMGSEPFMSPEVRGGLLAPLTCFSSRQADIWALGVILMNLICGSLPWSKASTNDHNFLTYLIDDHDYLYNNFPVSLEANDILKSIFTKDPRNRISIAALRERILAVRSFRKSAFEECDLSVPGEIFFDEGEELPVEYRRGDPRPFAKILNADIVARSRSVPDTIKALRALETPPRAIHNRRKPASARRSSPQSSGTDSTFVNGGDEISNVTFPEDYEDPIDEDSDEESEGPITPEQHATDAPRAGTTVDIGLEGLDGLTELDLGDGVVDSMGVSPSSLRISPVLPEKKSKFQIIHATPDRKGIMPPIGQPSARRMLMNAARMMGAPIRKVL